MNAAHDGPLDGLITALSLERLEKNLFRGSVTDVGVKRVFGGKVLGEAIKAAQSTVDEERAVHSIHCYFLREADSNNPVIYEVDRSRDGGSFSARRVVAIQYGRPIFTMEASFHKLESGMDYQGSAPEVDGPMAYQEFSVASILPANPSPQLQRIANISAPFEIRPVDSFIKEPKPGADPIRRMWVKTVGPLPDDADLHRAIAAYLSDYGLITTLLMPAGVSMRDPRLIMASLDHAMWFHRPFRMDEWLLYVCEGVSSFGARGLAKGSFFRENGELVLSVAQEGLIRLRDEV